MYLDVLNHCSNDQLVELITNKEIFNSICRDFYPSDGDNQGEMMYHDLMEVVSKRFVDLLTEHNDSFSGDSFIVNPIIEGGADISEHSLVHDHDDMHPDWPW